MTDQEARETLAKFVMDPTRKPFSILAGAVEYVSRYGDTLEKALAHNLEKKLFADLELLKTTARDDLKTD